MARYGGPEVLAVGVEGTPGLYRHGLIKQNKQCELPVGMIGVFAYMHALH